MSESKPIAVTPGHIEQVEASVERRRAARAARARVSAVLAPTAVVIALRRFEAVIVLFPPMVNSFGPGLVEVVAVSPCALT